MATTTERNMFKKVGLVIVMILAVYFIMSNALRYFAFTEEAYGPYYWPRVNWVFPHVIFGMMALMIGPFQFSKGLRAKYLNWHRRSGYVYLISIFFGGIAGMALALTSQVNLTYKMGLFFLAIAWLLTSGMAFASILKRKITQHQEWMVRSYVLTFAFVIFRLSDNILAFYQISSSDDRNALMSWACWSVPLLFTELILQYKKTFK